MLAVHVVVVAVAIVASDAAGQLVAVVQVLTVPAAVVAVVTEASDAAGQLVAVVQVLPVPAAVAAVAAEASDAAVSVTTLVTSVTLVTPRTKYCHAAQNILCGILLSSFLLD